MKKLLFCILIVMALASCRQKVITFENSTPEEIWEIMREYFMAPGVPVSNKRPLPNVLSEREVLLKAAEAAVKEGVLYPSYYAYENNPALTTAKIETPILMFDADTGIPRSYLLTAIDDDGIALAYVFVNSAHDTNGEPFEFSRIIIEPNGSIDHLITKREAAELIQSQFPDSEVSEPLLIGNLRLRDSRHSHSNIFWYFTVSETARNAAGEAGEYVFEPFVPGYSSIPGGMSNRAALNERGSFHLDGAFMAKLDTPIRLFDKLEAARAAGGVIFTPPWYLEVDVDFTPLPFK
jgi:hypothetical protein